MGLDMYIYHTNKTHHNIDELLKINATRNLNAASTEAQEFLPLREYEYLEGVFTIFHQAAYWRKANAIHAWFVDIVQDCNDDCGYYELTQQHLKQLKQVCEDALETNNTEHLQPRGGFFFGSLDIDDWFWNDVKRTIKQLNDVLAMDWNSRRFFYHSSW